MEEKDIYNTWLKSKKLLELRRKMEQKKRNILQLKLDYPKFVSEKMQNHFNRNELLNFIKTLTDYHQLTSQDKQAYEWIEFEFRNITDKDEFLIDFVRSILNLSFYLRKYELSEAFEICAQIRDAIIGEIKDALRILNTYFIATDEDIICVKEYPAFAREIIKKFYRTNESEKDK